MQKLKLQSTAAEAVTRIEICLPRVFPWKLRGGDKCATEAITKSITHIGGE
jgi:hypothetical protein